MTEKYASPEAASTEARLKRYVLYDEVNAPYLHWQLEQFAPYLGRRILEVGCGVGAIVAQLGTRDLVVAVDLEHELVEFTRKRFSTKAGYEFACVDISALSKETHESLKARSFDTVICINVLEHINDDAGAVATMADLLAPGGTLALLVPAHPSLFGAYDVTDGHFRRYTKRTLRKVLDAAGLNVERLYYFNAIGAAGWWLRYKLMRRNHQTQGDYKLMQLLLPMIKAVEGRIKPPVGMSLIAVGKKA